MPVSARCGRRAAPSAVAVIVASLVAVAFGGLTAGGRPGAAQTAPPTSWPEAWAVELRSEVISSGPTVADVDGDGRADIVFGDESGNLHVYDGDGRPVGGFPVRLSLDGGRTGAIGSSPLVTDLDRDGDVEIVVGLGTVYPVPPRAPYPPVDTGGVVAVDHRGGVIWTRVSRDVFDIDAAPRPDGFPEGVYTSPAAGDVDGDGWLDVVWGSFDFRVFAVDRFGNDVPGFPYLHWDTIWSSPAVSDVDGDGRAEVFVGADSSIPPRGFERFDKGLVYRLDWEQGTVAPRWMFPTTDIVQSSPAIGDIDGDGRLEVVVGSGFYHPTGGDEVWALDAETGSVLPGWPRSVGRDAFNAPSLGDLDGDGVPEVVMPSLDGFVYAFRGDGSTMWRVDPSRRVPNDPGGEYKASAAIADMDGDGRQDVVVTNAYVTYVLRGRDGARIDPFGAGGRAGLLNLNWSFNGGGQPVVADFGRPGTPDWRLVLLGFDPGGSLRSRLASYRMPRPGAAPAWPMYRHNSAHTGRAQLPTPRPPARTGYWMLERDGDVYAFGAADDLGDVPDTITDDAVDLAPQPSGRGYWVLTAGGAVSAFGDAGRHGSPDPARLSPGELPAALSATPSGRGYWVFTTTGRVLAFGDADHHGDLVELGVALDGPIVDSVATADGRGYLMVASDGGIFAFGSARFAGSVRGALNGGFPDQPVVGMVTDPDGRGYWLVAADGGVFAFDAPFVGSLPAIVPFARLQAPVNGMVASGNGYLQVAGDGGVFAFATDFWGSLGGNPPDTDIVSIAAVE